MKGSTIDRIVVGSEIRGDGDPELSIRFIEGEGALVSLRIDEEEIDALIATLIEHRLGTFPDAGSALRAIAEGIHDGMLCREKHLGD